MSDITTKTFYKLALRGLYIIIMKAEGHDVTDRVAEWGEDVLRYTSKL